MKKIAKTAFNMVALAAGGFGTVWGGFGLATGGWSSADKGGLDMTEFGFVFTLASVGLFYAGYKGIKNSVADSAPSKKPNVPS